MEQVVELFALACIEPVITDELSAIGQKENWRMRWSSSASWRVSPHVMWDDYFKRRNSNTPDPLLVDSPDEEFDAKVSDTQLYMSVIERAKLGERTVCIDEMTGIQASNVLPQTYHYGLVKFGESLSISVMEHKA